jgi:hypothetical protein
MTRNCAGACALVLLGVVTVAFGWVVDSLHALFGAVCATRPTLALAGLSLAGARRRGPGKADASGLLRAPQHRGGESASLAGVGHTTRYACCRGLPVELRARAGGTAAALRLVCADALRLEIAPGFDDATLRRLIGLLREALAS